MSTQDTAKTRIDQPRRRPAKRNTMQYARTLLIGLMFAFLSQKLLAGWVESSVVKHDEEVVFFPALAWQDTAGGPWQAEVHGWIFEPKPFGELLHLFRRALGMENHDDATEQSIFKQRARWFLVDNERNKRLSIHLGARHYALEKSTANGHMRGRLSWPAADFQSLLATHGDNDRLPFYVQARDERRFEGEILVVPRTGISVISDIDDTIKISNVLNKKQLLTNTFKRPFQAVPGMASQYQNWATQQGAVFHYVSASPWQLYPPLQTFFQAEGFPAGSFHLKTFRWKDRSFFNLFADPVKYKTALIEELLRRFPARRFILVGDAGEKDAEVYGAVARRFPQQILKIYIRTLEPGIDMRRFVAAFDGLAPAQWQLFATADAIKAPAW